MRFPGGLFRAVILTAFVGGLPGTGEPATAVATNTAGFVTADPRISGGSGPVVSIEAPSKPSGWGQEMVPKITVAGPPGTSARVEWATELSGPWTAWSNVVVSAEGVVLVDLRPGSFQRFYRALAEVNPSGPAGFVWIPPGTFVMGSPTSEWGRDTDEHQHAVTLTQGFWLSDHEVTQAEYREVMGSNPAYFTGLNRPVEQVTWHDAVAYCQRLTARERAAGRINDQQAYRLPTDAEWEYAVRAGTTGATYGNLDAIAWWDGNSGGQTQPVKRKAPNAWGLYDMIGNVWEWCADWYGDVTTDSVTDPRGPSSGSVRVFRGGSWVINTGGLRAAFRRGFDPDTLNYNLGFRPALSSIR